MSNPEPDFARTCPVGADVEVAIPAQTGNGKLETRCETMDGVQFICRPVPGNEICGERGIESISRDRVQCGREAACEDGQRSCTSDSQFVECHKGTWSPTLACPSDSRCFEGECVLDLRAGCEKGWTRGAGFGQVPIGRSHTESVPRL